MRGAGFLKHSLDLDLVVQLDGGSVPDGVVLRATIHSLQSVQDSQGQSDPYRNKRIYSASHFHACLERANDFTRVVGLRWRSHAVSVVMF
jgi:hypothetical protein